jgi:hypothetical protein
MEVNLVDLKKEFGYGSFGVDQYNINSAESLLTSEVSRIIF